MLWELMSGGGEGKEEAEEEEEGGGGGVKGLKDTLLKGELVHQVNVQA